MNGGTRGVSWHRTSTLPPSTRPGADIRVIAHATTPADHKRLLGATAPRFIHVPYDVDVDHECLGLVATRNAPRHGHPARAVPEAVVRGSLLPEQMPDEVGAMLHDGAAR